MFYKYKCGNEIIRVFVWNDNFSNGGNSEYYKKDEI